MLNDQSLKLLKLFSERDAISLNDLGAIHNTPPEDWCAPIAYLRREGFLEIHPDHVSLFGDDFTNSAPLRITYEGRCAFEAESKSRYRFTFNELRAWLTLLIAIAAFIKSFFIH